MQSKDPALITASQAKRVTIKLISGDRVSIELSPFDPTRGRILERL